MTDSAAETPRTLKTPNASKTKLLVAWLWVGIPLAWGVTQTVIKALGLF